MVDLLSAVSWERRAYGSTGIVRSVAAGNRPPHDGPDPTVDQPRGCRLLSPQRSQDRKNVVALDLVHPLCPQRGGMVQEMVSPLSFGPLTAPVLPMQPDHPLCSFRECWDTRASRIASLGNGPSILQSRLPRLGKGEDWVAAQPEIRCLPSDAHPLEEVLRYPAVGPGPDPKRQPVAASSVAVDAGRLHRSAERRTQRLSMLHRVTPCIRSKCPSWYHFLTEIR